MVEDRLRRLLPFMGQEHALAKRTALAWTVEGDDREAHLGQRLEEGVELLNERVVAAVKEEGGNLPACCGQAESGKMAARVWDFDSLVALHALHGARMRAGEIIVVAVSKISGGQKELRLMVIRRGIRPALP